MFEALKQALIFNLHVLSSQVRTARGVLPKGHPQRTDTLLEKAAAIVEGPEKEEAESILLELADQEDKAFYQVCLDSCLCAFVGGPMVQWYFHSANARPGGIG